MIHDKKRLQIKIDQELNDEANAVFAQLGLTPTAVITAMYKRAVAEGAVPFSLSLTEDEKTALALNQAVAEYDAPLITGKKAVADYLLGDDDEDE
ncbi:type II toxin-antitoxin system RelB/DinJ family antitoxin [Lacticaseibacillus parakribbianus]|uniref:type II toxin-antitoxin system RelB/DinJ family antitoxin n=1 Tax=Lacticaseibacillus parakribbianus TaxID=2970927 RepID=UPI0021CB3515|nr:type II toxin-antitoxin system RelB/DinJ family antitoxin [Lacticaseibacillus parakribbianus]